MYLFVLLVFVFFYGAIFGYIVEVLYRHFTDKNKSFVNPGFCVGPWLPIYGVSFLIVFFLTFLESTIPIQNDIIKKSVLFAIMSFSITMIELIGGFILLKFINIRLWDYSDEKFNFKGFICLKYSFYWWLMGAIYYFFIHKRIYDATVWLSKNIIFSFVIGFFFGIFIIDIIYSSNVIAKIKQYSIENNIIIKYENLKNEFIKQQSKNKEKIKFFVFMLKENINNLIKEK